MGIRSLSSASISTGVKRSKFWDQIASIPYTGPAWDSIATATPSGVNTFDFTSIPSTYKFLRIVSTHKTNVGTTVDNIQMTFNDDTANNYSFTYSYAQNTSIGGNNTTAGSCFYMRALGSGGNSNGFYATAVVDIYDYSNTSKWTTVHSHGGAVGNSNENEVWFMNSTWANTSVVNKITIGYGAGSFVSGSEFHLYGIKG